MNDQDDSARAWSLEAVERANRGGRLGEYTGPGTPPRRQDKGPPSPPRKVSKRLQEAGQKVARQAQDRLNSARDRLAALEAERDDLAALPAPNREQQHRLLDVEVEIAKLEGSLPRLERETLLPPECRDNPTKIFAGDLLGGPTDLRMRPDRIYLDVTEATLKQVGEYWTVVEYAKGLLKDRGLPTSALRGRPEAPTPGSQTDWTYWSSRVAELGEPAAYEEYRDRTPRGPGRAKRWDNRFGRAERRQKSGK